MFRLALIRPSPRTLLSTITHLRHANPSSILRPSPRRTNTGSRLLVVSCTRSPNIPNEAPNAGVIEAFRAWERAKVVAVCSGGDRRAVAERGMENTRFGIGNWFLRQESSGGQAEEGMMGRRRAPLSGGVKVPPALAAAMAMSIAGKIGGMKMRERSLSGITLVDKEGEDSRLENGLERQGMNRWLVLC